jgi:hypothetical protein
VADLLTADELAAVDLAARLAEALGRVVGDGPTRKADLNELLVHVHAIQNAVLAQAAARAYPDRFRLLGQVVEAKSEPELKVTFISQWRPYAAWQVADMTGRPIEEIRDLYGETVNVLTDLRGPLKFRRGGPKPSVAEVREARGILARALEGRDG